MVEMVLVFCNCLSAGIFMGVCLLIFMILGFLLQEDYYKEMEIQGQYPLFGMALGVGFFSIITLEKLLRRKYINDKTFVALVRRIVLKKKPSMIAVPTRTVVTVASSAERMPTPSTSSSEGSKRNYRGRMGSISHLAVPYVDRNDRPIVRLPGSRKYRFSADQYRRNSRSYRGTLVAEDIALPVERRLSFNIEFNESFSCLIYMLTLCFHSLFEGVAVGLQLEIKDIFKILLAIVLYKCCISFSLGQKVFLLYQNQPVIAFSCALVFSAMTPFGITIGMLLSALDLIKSTRLLISVLVVGVSSGTFMYVTFIELFQEQLADKHRHIFFRLFTIFCGFSIMVLVKIIDNGKSIMMLLLNDEEHQMTTEIPAY